MPASVVKIFSDASKGSNISNPTWACAFTGALVGDSIFVFIAFDNLTTTTPTLTSISISTPNGAVISWNSTPEVVFNSPQSAAGGGIRGELWRGDVTTAGDVSSVQTTWTGGVAAAGTVLFHTRGVGALNRSYGTPVTSGTSSVTYFAGEGTLFLHVGATESNAAMTTFSPTNSTNTYLSAMESIGTTGGGAAANLWVMGNGGSPGVGGDSNTASATPSDGGHIFVVYDPASTGTPTASAGFSGSGSLSAVGVSPSVTKAVALSGSGSLSTTQKPSTSASAALSGSGVLSVTPVIAFTANVALSGSGTLAASGLVLAVRNADLSGSGALSTTVVPKPIVAVGLSGSGSLSVTTKATVTAAVNLSGSGSLSAVANGLSASASLSGSGSLSATGTPTITTAVSLSGSGSLSAVGTPKAVASVSLSGSGTLAASANAPIGIANLSGSGTLSAVAGSVTQSASVALGGSGTLSASGKPMVTKAVGLSGSGALSVTTKATVTAPVTLSGSGVLSVTIKPMLKGTGALGGSGTLAASFGLRMDKVINGVIVVGTLKDGKVGGVVKPVTRGEVKRSGSFIPLK